MDIKTAVNVLQGLEYKLRGSAYEYDQILMEAIDLVLENINCEKSATVLFVCDKKKCETCSFPTCRYTTDPAHAISLVINEAGIYKEKETRHKKKKFKDILKEAMYTNEKTKP